MTLKHTQDSDGPKRTKILLKNNNVRKSELSDIKTYYKTIITKKNCGLSVDIDKQINQQNLGPNTDPNTHRNLIHDRTSIANQLGKEVLFYEGCIVKGDSKSIRYTTHAKKNVYT